MKHFREKKKRNFQTSRWCRNCIFN